MQHVAIMKTSWGLTKKILTGEKTIESRWLSIRCKPWDAVEAGESVFFKNAGEPITLRAEVRKVLQFDELSPKKVKSILTAYGRDDGIEPTEVPAYFQRFKDKKYCILIFLKNPRAVRRFEINKRGFGAMCAWISVPNVQTIRKKT